MAQQQIVVDADNLRSEGRSFEAVGEDFLNAVDQMMSRLETLEKGDTPPWGDDDLGEKFGVVYEGLRDGMEESMKSLGTRLGEMGQKLQGMAANHEANESRPAAGSTRWAAGWTDSATGSARCPARCTDPFSHRARPAFVPAPQPLTVRRSLFFARGE